jgi:hypothetical protein
MFKLFSWGSIKRERPGAMTAAELHSAGATIRHDSPFAALPVPATAIDAASLPEWSRPLFITGLFEPDETVMLVGDHIALVDAELVLALLSVFNWRPRTIGAHLAALRGLASLEEEIGNLLLRSDVCWAGRAYSLALARFNTPRSLQFLTRYLEYYLTRRDLSFEQQYVLATVICLDERNGPTIAREFESPWREYSRDGPNVALAAEVDRVRHQLEFLERFSAATDSPRDGS